jgi:hypothetical protein
MRVENNDLAMLFRNCTDAIEDSPIEGVFIRAQKWIPP